MAEEPYLLTADAAPRSCRNITSFILSWTVLVWRVDLTGDGCVGLLDAGFACFEAGSGGRGVVGNGDGKGTETTFAPSFGQSSRKS